MLEGRLPYHPVNLITQNLGKNFQRDHIDIALVVIRTYTGTRLTALHHHPTRTPFKIAPGLLGKGLHAGLGFRVFFADLGDRDQARAERCIHRSFALEGRHLNRAVRNLNRLKTDIHRASHVHMAGVLQDGRFHQGTARTAEDVFGIDQLQLAFQHGGPYEHRGTETELPHINVVARHFQQIGCCGHTQAGINDHRHSVLTRPGRALAAQLGNHRDITPVAIQHAQPPELPPNRQ